MHCAQAVPDAHCRCQRARARRHGWGWPAGHLIPGDPPVLPLFLDAADQWRAHFGAAGGCRNCEMPALGLDGCCGARPDPRPNASQADVAAWWVDLHEKSSGSSRLNSCRSYC
eukprot:9241670-Alexandrium_andersonii.AAC.1